MVYVQIMYLHHTSELSYTKTKKQVQSYLYKTVIKPFKK